MLKCFGENEFGRKMVLFQGVSQLSPDFLNILLELCFFLKEDPPLFVFLNKKFLKNQ